MSKFFEDTMQGLLEAAAIEMNKDVCRYCGKEIVYGVEPLPIIYSFGNETAYYCGEHAEMGSEIFDRFLSEKSRIKSTEGYCDEEKLLHKIESQYKTNCGDWNISFPNLRHSGKELLNAPILKDGKPIGFITDVTDECVTGRIWSRYIPIVEEIATSDQHTMSFEIVC